MNTHGKTHELKTWPEHFAALARGQKPFEVRRDDRGFEVGDLLLLREYNPETEVYSGAQAKARVTYVLPGGWFGIEAGYCVLGLAAVEAEAWAPGRLVGRWIYFRRGASARNQVEKAWVQAQRSGVLLELAGTRLPTRFPTLLVLAEVFLLLVQTVEEEAAGGPEAAELEQDNKGAET